MPSDIKMWKRIEIPAELHRELEREARVVHMSTQAYAAYLLSRGLQRDRALAEIPFNARHPQGDPTTSAGANGADADLHSNLVATHDPR